MTRPGREWVFAGALVACAVVGFGLRYTGQVPYGSDNDEYLLVGHTLLTRGEPTVGGIEGTKYPLGLPVVLAGFEAMGLPPAQTWILVNALLVLLVAFLSVRLAARAMDVGPAHAAPWIAGLCCVLGYALWHRAGYVMADVAFTAVVLAAIDVEERRFWGAVTALTLLAVAAVSLRSVGIALAAGVSLALVLRPSTRRVSFVPLLSALVVMVATMVWISRFPVHTTAYGQDLWLRNPFDAAAGKLGVLGVLARGPAGLFHLVRDTGTAILGTPVPVLASASVALVAVALWRLHSVVAWTFTVGYSGVVAIWTYHSVRFGLPFVPLAAVGAALVVRWAFARAGGGWIAGVACSACVVAFLAPQVVRLHRLGRWEAAHLRRVDAAAARVSMRLSHLDVPVASFDYRELARRAGRPVLPLVYTSDTAAVIARLHRRGVRALVLTPHGRDARGRYGRRLLAALGSSATPTYDDGIFRIVRLPAY